MSQMIIAPLKFVIYTDSNKIINKKKDWHCGLNKLAHFYS